MTRFTQLTLQDEMKSRLVHGGQYAVGRRKAARPIATKRAMHLVLRSSKAKGERSFLRKDNARFIEKLVEGLSKETFVHVYELGNAGNHLHLLVRPKTREGFKRFLRIMTGSIAMRVGGGKKGHFVGKFWDLLPFTRIVEWGKAFAHAKAYVLQNVLEGAGLIPYQARGKKSRRDSS